MLYRSLLHYGLFTDGFNITDMEPTPRRNAIFEAVLVLFAVWQLFGAWNFPGLLASGELIPDQNTPLSFALFGVTYGVGLVAMLLVGAGMLTGYLKGQISRRYRILAGAFLVIYLLSLSLLAVDVLILR